MKMKFLKYVSIICVIALSMPQLMLGQFSLTISQSQVVSTVVPPANTPLLGSGLNCTAQTGGLAGTFSAGTFVVAYTYTGAASSSETKASADGGSTLTTVVTCPANGTMVIPSPPTPPGCNPAICTGWRAYVVASSSGTGAELLQTITALNSSGVGCTLSALSNLTSCALGSSLTLTSLGAGAAEPTNPTLFIAPVSGTTMGAFLPISEASLNITNHYLSWITTGTAATCTIAVQTSSDNITFTTAGTAQTCTSSGSYYLNTAASNFIRVNLTAFTATGANVPSIAWTLVDSPSTLSSVTVTGCGSTTTCTPNATLPGTNIKVVFGVVTLAGNTATITGIPAFSATTSYSCAVTDQTTAQLVKVVNTSTTSITISDTVGATDVVSYVCVGT
jgi:hypothetical protein